MFERYLMPLAIAAGAWTAWLWWHLHNRGRNRLARPGTVFVCHVCGKRSHDKFGTQAIDHGWDTSCITWAELCDERSLVFDEDGRVQKATAA